MIEISGLHVRYGHHEVLKGISLQAGRNEILGVIGPAQSGKTTLLKTINRTIDDIPGASVAGTVKVDGEDVRRMKDVFSLRRKVGMVAPLPVGLRSPYSTMLPLRPAWPAYGMARNWKRA